MVPTDVVPANHVSVTLEGAGAEAEAEQTAQRYADETADWPRRAVRPDPGDPPDSPAQHLHGVTVHVPDDVGTRDQPSSSGSGGGDGWRVVHRYRPLPPAGATSLRLVLVHDRDVVGSVDVRLPRPACADGS